MRFEQRFGITHPENYEGASSGICLTYQVFMDYVFPVLADEIKGKSQEEAIQIISDYLNDYLTVRVLKISKDTHGQAA